MTLARRIGAAVAALVLAPLLAACDFTGDAELTDTGRIKLDLTVTGAGQICLEDPTQPLFEGLKIEPVEQSGGCRVTGTAGPELAAVLGVFVERDESGYRLTTSPAMASWESHTVDIKVRFPGPITEFDGVDQIGPDQIELNYSGQQEMPRIRVSSRAGYGPSRVEWAAGIGLVSGVALTLLGFGLRRLRRNHLAAANAPEWPAPDGATVGVRGPQPASPSDAAFWSGAAEPPPPVVGERTKRTDADPSVWAPPHD